MVATTEPLGLRPGGFFVPAKGSDNRWVYCGWSYRTQTDDAWENEAGPQAFALLW